MPAASVSNSERQRAERTARAAAASIGGPGQAPSPTRLSAASDANSGAGRRRTRAANRPVASHRRHELLEWAGTTGGLVVEDDHDAEFRYDRAPVGCLQGLGADHVVLGGSLSKTLAPALRLGWLVVPEPLVGAFAEAK